MTSKVGSTIEASSMANSLAYSFTMENEEVVILTVEVPVISCVKRTTQETVKSNLTEEDMIEEAT